MIYGVSRAASAPVTYFNLKCTLQAEVAVPELDSDFEYASLAMKSLSRIAHAILAGVMLYVDTVSGIRCSSIEP